MATPKKKALKSKVAKKRKAKAPRKTAGYVLIYKKKSYEYYSSKTETKVVICKNEAAVLKALQKFGKDFAFTKAPRFNKSMSTVWVTPDMGITVIKGDIISPKLAVSLKLTV